ncbi:cytidylyltransferase domain-containing protein [Hoeflea sp.]|uniref:acylneuraminate cytidylyltransferase family protein n=1 Tax=Hoeflea sp. TaxID=1940281 RepID=UPI003BAF2AE8
MKRLCTICARGGSKGVPNKNLMTIAGMPLIAHSVKQAIASGLFDAIACSSDSPALLEAAIAAGATLAIRRPDELATDTAAKLPVLHHALTTAERELGQRYVTYVDLDATSPLRLPDDIAGAVRLLEGTGVPSVITAAPSRRSPYFNLVELTGEGYVRLSKPLPENVVRRQDAPSTFDMNASIYVWNAEVFREDPKVFYPTTMLFEMPEERSIDIDSPLDLKIVRFLLEQKEPNP